MKSIADILSDFPSKLLKDKDIEDWVKKAKYVIVRNGIVYIVNFETYDLINGNKNKNI